MGTYELMAQPFFYIIVLFLFVPTTFLWGHTLANSVDNYYPISDQLVTDTMIARVSNLCLSNENDAGNIIANVIDIDKLNEKNLINCMGKSENIIPIKITVVYGDEIRSSKTSNKGYETKTKRIVLVHDSQNDMLVQGYMTVET